MTGPGRARAPAELDDVAGQRALGGSAPSCSASRQARSSVLRRVARLSQIGPSDGVMRSSRCDRERLRRADRRGGRGRRLQLFVLARRDVAERGVQPDVVKPADPFDDRELGLLVGAPDAV